ncbi:MAG: YqzL family protein [Firmicutes bacterium]|jgi:hypothetical protein|nr:YqzL family protein [Bacillota bacterium]
MHRTGINWKGGVPLKLTADFFWKLFEATGSITAYLLYKHYRTVKAIMN